MNRSGSAREALIAEALGDLSALLDRIDQLIPVLTAARQATITSGERLSDQLADFEARLDSISQTARTHVVKHIVRQTEEAARRARQESAKVLADVVRDTLRAEFEQAVRRSPRRYPRCCSWGFSNPWLSHAATAAVSSVLTWVAFNLIQG